MCTVCFYDMYVKKCIKYYKRFDFIEGFEDLGHYGRTNKCANCVLVFMAEVFIHHGNFQLLIFLLILELRKPIY